MPNDLDDAYADIGEMCADLFKEMGIEQPSREDFDKLMGPLLQETPKEAAEQLSSAASFDDDADFVIDRGLAGNTAFTNEMQAELRRRLDRKKTTGLPQKN